MSPTRRAARQQVRYRVTVADVIDGAATVVMDATGAGFMLPWVSWMAIACSLSTASVVTPTCWSISPS